MAKNKKIGIFDSGFGGLTVFKEIHKLMPEYDYIYLGDNARAPYGPKSFETVFHYTWQCVEWLISQGCNLIILACNTASARALRRIQKNNLKAYQDVRVLGVIRPTAEVIGQFSHTNTIGVLGTEGTINSGSYINEINKFYPKTKVYQHACKLWVPLVEDNAFHTKDIDYIILNDLKKLFRHSKKIDTVLLGCTHYPLLMRKIKKLLPMPAKVVSQGQIVAKSLEDYLYRHPEIESVIARNSKILFYTSDDPEKFEKIGSIFFGKEIKAKHINPENPKEVLV